MAAQPTSELQSVVTVSVEGIGQIGKFDKRTGGDANAKPVLFRPGGSPHQLAVPVLPVLSTITLSRYYGLDRDVALVGKLMQLAGHAKVTVTEQPLDHDFNPYGTPRVYVGMLADVNPGNYDSNVETERVWDMTVEPYQVTN